MDELIQKLKSQREAQGLSIQDLFERTRINPDFLSALEAGDFDVLPEAYVKLFLKRYAQEVKLDSDEIVKEYERILWQKRAAEAPQEEEKETGGTGWVIGVAGALLVGLVAAAVVWQTRSDPTPAALDRSQTSAETAATRESAPSPDLDLTGVPAAGTDGSTTALGRIETEPGATAATETAEPEEPSTTESTGAPGITPPVTETDEPAENAAAPAVPTAETVPAPAESPVPDPPAGVGSDREGNPEGVAENEGVVSPGDSSPEADVENERVVSAGDDSPEDAVENERIVSAGDENPEDVVENERVVSAYSLSLRQDLSTVPGDLTLSVRGLEATRVVIVSDGDEVFDGVIEGGRRNAWRARDRFLVEVGKGSGVRLQLQDETLRGLGTEGRKVRLFISRSSIWVEEIASPEPASQADPAAESEPASPDAP